MDSKLKFFNNKKVKKEYALLNSIIAYPFLPTTSFSFCRLRSTDVLKIEV